MQKEFSAIEYSCHLGGSEAIVNFICEARVNVFRREAKGAYAKKCSATEFFLLKGRTCTQVCSATLEGAKKPQLAKPRVYFLSEEQSRAYAKGVLCHRVFLPPGSATGEDKVLFFQRGVNHRLCKESVPSQSILARVGIVS